MANDFPVHQISGVQYRNTRHAVKTGCNHVEVISDLYKIRVGIIGINYLQK
jgi:hypothetical protein